MKLEKTNVPKWQVLLLFFFGLSVNIVHAQKEFVEGYILTNQNDTLSGFIEYSYKIIKKNRTQCRFKATRESEIQEFSPFEILAYRIKDSKYFVSKRIGSATFFVELLIKGKVKIYYDYDNTGEHYYIEKEGLGLNELLFEEKLVAIEGKQFEKLSTAHQGMLRYYMQDTPVLFDQIKSIKKPSHKSMIKLSKTYHDLVGKDEVCEIFEKNTQPFSLFVAPAIGRFFYREGGTKEADILHFPSSYYGALVKLNEKQISEKINIRSGILFSQKYAVDTLVYQFQRVPIFVEYVFPSRIIEISISVGWNYTNIKVFEQNMVYKAQYRAAPLTSTIGILKPINKKWIFYADVGISRLNLMMGIYRKV